MQIDIFTLMSGRRFAEVLRDADRFEVSGHRIEVASKRSLMEWKESSPRDKDRLDAGALRQLLEDPNAFD